MLAALLLVPLLVMAYLNVQARRRRLLVQYGGTSLAQGGAAQRAGSRSAVRRHLPAVVFLAALSTLIVALARPHAQVSLPIMQGTVILAFDVSGSMVADDVKPTRLDAAKAAARRFVEQQPAGVQVGIVTFSTVGFSSQAPTEETGVLLSAIERLKVQTGTSIGTGVDAALKAIELSAGRTGDLAGDEPMSLAEPQPDAPVPTPAPVGSYRSAVIVLLTDGENTQNPSPLEAVQGAADRGIRIYTVGIGSIEGATLDLDGFQVRSRLDEETLRAIAERTGGEYYDAAAQEDFSGIYNNLAPELVFKPQSTEITALFAGAGIFLLLAGSALSLFWLGRVP